jgi:Spy/CpxP family protein refolding chaperone
MRTIAILATIGVLAVPAGLAGVAEAREQSSSAQPGARPPSNWWKTPKYIQELKLTADQSAEIEQIVQSSMTRLRADKDDLDRAQGDFRMLMEQPKASQRELLKAAERLEMARFLISKERTQMLVRIHSVLTPDQRVGLDNIAKRHEERNRQKQNQTQNQSQK